MATKGQIEIAKLLLDNGADVNCADYGVFTVLMWAAADSQSEAAKILLENGADPNIKNNLGANAWDLAKN